MADRSQLSVAVVTMVRDDETFLKLWLGYYGGQFGASALYVVNHGDTDMVRDLARGSNVIAIPYGKNRKFDARRWRLLNHLVRGLRIFHDLVIVGDVDELVVADPRRGSLSDMLAALPKAPVVTPLGLDLVHRPATEPAPLDLPLLAHRSHVRPAPQYSKPCIVRNPVHLSRGGHYSTCDRLTLPEDLYLLHLKHCDRDLFVETMNRRNQMAAETGVPQPRDAMIGRHWFPVARNDAETFAAIDRAPVADAFDLSELRQDMRSSWRKRPDTDFWESTPPPVTSLYRLPERFAAVL